MAFLMVLQMAKLMEHLIDGVDDGINDGINDGAVVWSDGDGVSWLTSRQVFGVLQTQLPVLHIKSTF